MNSPPPGETYIDENGGKEAIRENTMIVDCPFVVIIIRIGQEYSDVTTKDREGVSFGEGLRLVFKRTAVNSEERWREVR